MSKFVTEDGATISYPTPKKLIAMQQFMSYKCAMKQLYHKQQMEFNLNSAWETVWQPQFQTLRNHVKLRKQKVRKANYAEKIDAEFEPYAIVERYGVSRTRCGSCIFQQFCQQCIAPQSLCSL